MFPLPGHEALQGSITRNRGMLAAFFLCLGIGLGGRGVHAQQEIGFIEKFALASDRREALAELIPGTHEYYFFHCLHHQNEGHLAEAGAMLDAWRAKMGNHEQANSMWLRQQLLSYHENPQRTLQTLREQLGVQLNHAPPSRDQAAALADALDNSQLEISKLLDEAIAQDRSLGRIESSALPLLFDRKLSPDQLRSLLGRLSRADFSDVVRLVAEELVLKDTRGFGWAGLHSRLTLAQLDALLERVPNLIENEAFIRAYTARLAPPAGVSLSDKAELRAYLERLLAWSRRLPASQSSFQASVLANLLRLDMSEGKFDREQFLRYLAFPRQASYYNPRLIEARRTPLIELGFVMNPELKLPPIGNDDELIRRYLEHFLQTEESVDDYAAFLNREYLDRVLAETRILYGIGNAATWYAKLSPAEQRALRERVELRFDPQNMHQYSPQDAVRLNVELKNVDQLIVKIYEINTLSYYRSNTKPIDTSLDLDGLVANAQRKLQFEQPADRRHSATIEFPEMQGKGIWIVDLLGGGGRSRALIQKGQLRMLERLGDAGQVFRVIDEAGQPVPEAHIELNGRTYMPDEQGQIILPYSEKAVTRNLLLVEGGFASMVTMINYSESYALQAGFLVDRQSLIAGSQATVVIHPRLTCNDQPIQVSLLEDAQLTITATDAEGVSTSQTVGDLSLEDGDELTHNFLVPQRSRQLHFELAGQVYNVSRDVKETVRTNYSVACNAIDQTAQIGDFFLRSVPEGYQLLVLGRNGEAISRHPVTVQLKLEQFTNHRQFALATDEDGIIRLGELANVEQVIVSASQMRGSTFNLNRFHRHWPSLIQVGMEASIELPLGVNEADEDEFTLVEIRNGVNYAEHTSKIEFLSGSIKITNLPAGDFILEDHQAGQRVRLAVADAETQDQFAAGKNRVLQVERRRPLIIRDATVDGDELVVRVDGADVMSRVHVIADALLPDSQAAAMLELPYLPMSSHRYEVPHSLYVDSLRLDEEYSYILDRQGLKKYPGNLLPQPTVLVNPWEVSVTENATVEAQLGDMMPSMAPPAEPSLERRAGGEAADEGPRPDWKSYDFLADGSRLGTNLAIVNGEVRLPLENLGAASSLTIVAIHPTSLDSRSLTLPAADLSLRDQRLSEAFSGDKHLAQTQRIRLLLAGESVNLGDARTRRLQIYSSVADVYQLYATILENPEWEKFRFITQWHKLSDEEKSAHYNKMACHELEFFLYHKDRKFFDAVVKPLIEQKQEKQLVDQWLLDRPLGNYMELWRRQRLNTLERVLLAERLQADREGTLRWLRETIESNPLDPAWRQKRFEVALRGNALEATDLSVSGRFDANFFSTPDTASRGRYLEEKEALGGRGGAVRQKRKSEMIADNGVALELGADFGVDRQAGRGLARLGEVVRNYQTLDATREWAETQYYRTRLSDQTPDLIPINAFWSELLEESSKPFLTEHLDIPCNSLTEALCALAVIDLPFDGQPPAIVVEKNELLVTPATSAIAFVESIEASEENDAQDTILVGQDIYLAQPSTNDDANRPVQEQALLAGVPYRASVVVTNPTSSNRRVAVLTQLPSGSLPLAGSKLTRSTALELQAYSTAKIEYQFYFPVAGEFEHYGAQVSDGTANVAATPSRKLQVLNEPDQVDETTWSYVADWGTNEQVMNFLSQANLQQLDLSRIAFRMKDREFFSRVIQFLTANGRFEPVLWAYAIEHNQPEPIEQLLQNRPDFLQKLGPVLESPLVEVLPAEQFSYEHLDYRPLVTARSHQLGPKPRILNPSMHAQYHSFLNVIAHQPKLNNEQSLSLCYYLLLQNRIEEALGRFDEIQSESLETQLQYDYFTAYLQFYRGEWAKAAELASKYIAYPVPRWQELFRQIVQQVRQREAMLAGENYVSDLEGTGGDQASQRILVDGREAQQSAMAVQSPVLDLTFDENRLVLGYSNVESVEVNYYLMDIELLFSRNPFVVRGDDQVPVIRPNVSERVPLEDSAAVRQLNIPEEIRNRNVLVEVTAEGISRSTVVTANSLMVNLVERMGRLQVLSSEDRSPATGAYVKVYARHADGTVRFFKDGYTDLRGQFDYATLSTSELDTVSRFAILVLDERRGAVVREAGVPTR